MTGETLHCVLIFIELQIALHMNPCQCNGRLLQDTHSSDIKFTQI